MEIFVALIALAATILFALPKIARAFENEWNVGIKFLTPVSNWGKPYAIGVIIGLIVANEYQKYLLYISGVSILILVIWLIKEVMVAISKYNGRRKSKSD